MSEQAQVQPDVSQLPEVQTDVETSARQKSGTWRDLFTKDYWKEWFIPPDTDGDEEYKRVKDPTVDTDGYQQAAWEEVRRPKDMREEELQWLSICCNDIAGDPVVLVCPEKLEDAAVSSEQLYQHLIVTMDKVVDARYSVVVAMAPGNQHLAGQVLALRPFYERLPVKYKLRLSKVMVMFGTRGLRTSMTLSCPFFSHSFWGKVTFIQHLEDLWQVIEKEKILPSLPKAVVRAGTNSREAIHELSQLNQQDDAVGMAADPVVTATPEVC